jgi:hypothetical protein
MLVTRASTVAFSAHLIWWLRIVCYFAITLPSVGQPLLTKTSFSEDQLDQAMVVSSFELRRLFLLDWKAQLKSCWIVLDFVCRALCPRSVKGRPEWPFGDTYIELTLSDGLIVGKFSTPWRRFVELLRDKLRDNSLRKVKDANEQAFFINTIWLQGSRLYFRILSWDSFSGTQWSISLQKRRKVCNRLAHSNKFDF